MLSTYIYPFVPTDSCKEPKMEGTISSSAMPSMTFPFLTI
jgi:hypothetical protein